MVVSEIYSCQTHWNTLIELLIRSIFHCTARVRTRIFLLRCTRWREKYASQVCVVNMEREKGIDRITFLEHRTTPFKAHEGSMLAKILWLIYSSWSFACDLYFFFKTFPNKIAKFLMCFAFNDVRNEILGKYMLLIDTTHISRSN